MGTPPTATGVPGRRELTSTGTTEEVEPSPTYTTLPAEAEATTRASSATASGFPIVPSVNPTGMIPGTPTSVTYASRPGRCPPLDPPPKPPTAHTTTTTTTITPTTAATVLRTPRRSPLRGLGCLACRALRLGDAACRGCCSASPGPEAPSLVSSLIYEKPSFPCRSSTALRPAYFPVPDAPRPAAGAGLGVPHTSWDSGRTCRPHSWDQLPPMATIEPLRVSFDAVPSAMASPNSATRPLLAAIQ